MSLEQLGIEVGKYIKVRIPGATPWAEIIEITPNGFMGRIANKLFHEYSEHEQAQVTKRDWGSVEKLPKLNDYKQDDIVEFSWQSFTSEAYPDEVFYNWEPKT